MASEQQAEIDYPGSDDRPFGEDDLHRNWMIRIIEALEFAFQNQRVYVSGDLLLYYEEGNPDTFVVPDAFVVKDCNPGPRENYKLWEERKPPNFVLETTSYSSSRRDTHIKRLLYAKLGIREYFLYDPAREYLQPPLCGYRLKKRAYVPLAAGPDGFITSRELNLSFGLEQNELVIRTAGERLRTGAERAALEKARADQAFAELDQERARADRESHARRAAQAEVAKLRAELELARRTKGGPAH